MLRIQRPLRPELRAGRGADDANERGGHNESTAEFGTHRSTSWRTSRTGATAIGDAANCSEAIHKESVW
jgi:hypothetical protein